MGMVGWIKCNIRLGMKCKTRLKHIQLCICNCGHGSANSWQHELEEDEKGLIENGPAIDDNTTDT